MILNREIVQANENTYFVYVSSYFSKNGIVRTYYNPTQNDYQVTEHININTEPIVLKKAKTLNEISDILNRDNLFNQSDDKDFLFRKPHLIINDREKTLHLKVKYYKGGFKDYQVIIPNFCNLLINANLDDAIAFFNNRSYKHIKQ